MFFNKRTYHYQMYSKDKTGAFRILVALNKYEDIYSDWDPSPFKRRDIEEDFIEYVNDSALDIPMNEKINIVFLIEKEKRDIQKEKQLLNALNNHFNYTLRKKQREYYEEQKESFRYLIIGIILAMLVYSKLLEGVSIWNKIFEEGMVIGTWVFFWEAFYNFFIDCGKLRSEKKLINRFLESNYIFEDK